MSKSKNKRKKSVNQKKKADSTANLASNEAAEASTNAQKPAKKKAKRPPSKKTSQQPEATGFMSRRNAIRALIALPVAGVAGAAIHRYDVQNRGLHDLAEIGQGKPVVVQVHDPACQLCRRLMNNTRKALKGRDNIVFRVADVTKGDGAEFQQKYSANTVSLLLFDADGKRVDTVQGVTPVEDLKSRFAALN